MTVLDNPWKITGVQIKGLNNLHLPFKSHLLEGIDSDALIDPWQATNGDKYYVKSITGLEPPERDVAIARTSSGGKYQGQSVAPREIVVLVGLNPNFAKGDSFQSLRQDLETMLYPGYDPRVDIVLMSTIFPAYHEYAYVTKFEASIFDKDPAVQITFETLNPTFRAMQPYTYAPADLSEKHPDIYNVGNGACGFKFAVKFTDTKNGWFIKQSGHKNIGMIFDMTFHDGDILFVSTVPGERYVHWKKHRGKVKNMLSILTNNSEWLLLHPGHNHFIVPKKTSTWDWKGKLSFVPLWTGI